MRPTLFGQEAVAGIFQSTHPCRMRLKPPYLSLGDEPHFNPRIRVGCDAQRNLGAVAATIISIHASM